MARARTAVLAIAVVAVIAGAGFVAPAPASAAGRTTVTVNLSCLYPAKLTGDVRIYSALKRKWTTHKAPSRGQAGIKIEYDRDLLRRDGDNIGVAFKCRYGGQTGSYTRSATVPRNGGDLDFCDVKGLKCRLSWREAWFLFKLLVLKRG